MKIFSLLTVELLLLLLLGCCWSVTAVTSLNQNLVCYYDAASYTRNGLAQFTHEDLNTALQFCTHVVYGYVGINADNFRMTSLNEQVDVQRRNFAQFTYLKERYPHIKFLLSVGGDRDNANSEKYINLLESGRQRQTAFVESARDMLRMYNFDGLDLAFQFPKNKPRKVHSDAGSVWKSFKKFFTGDFIVDENAETHKNQFTDLVTSLKNAFRPHNLLLSLTVLPNVNSSWHYNAPAIIDSLDFVNLNAFDFVTPERNPEEADYTAPLYELFGQNRMPHYNVDYQVSYWLRQRVPPSKINVGVASYGRAWKLTEDSGSTGVPVVAATNGVAPAGPQSQKPGFLNWAEVCMLLPNHQNANNRGGNAALRLVTDPTKRYGTYAYRANGEHGMWVSYEDPETAGNKAGYVKVKSLGGIALFDLTQDDFRGQCTGDKFPMLRAIKYRLDN